MGGRRLAALPPHQKLNVSLCRRKGLFFSNWLRIASISSFKSLYENQAIITLVRSRHIVQLATGNRKSVLEAESAFDILTTKRTAASVGEGDCRARARKRIERVLFLRSPPNGEWPRDYPMGKLSYSQRPIPFAFPALSKRSENRAYSETLLRSFSQILELRYVLTSRLIAAQKVDYVYFEAFKSFGFILFSICTKISTP